MNPKVKALIAALGDVNIEEAISTAAVAAAPVAAAPIAADVVVEEEEEEEESKEEGEESGNGLVLAHSLDNFFYEDNAHIVHSEQAIKNFLYRSFVPNKQTHISFRMIY